MTAFLLYFIMLGYSEWIVIAIIVLILFGGKKIPELMKGLGKGISEFKKATKEDETDNQIQDTTKKEDN